MTNMHDVELFPVLDIDLFPEPAAYEPRTDVFLAQQPDRTAPEVPIEKETLTKGKKPTEKTENITENSIPQKPKQTASQRPEKNARVYISDVEKKPKESAQKLPLNNELWFWIIEIILVLCNAWIIAVVLYIWKNKSKLQAKAQKQKK